MSANGHDPETVSSTSHPHNTFLNVIHVNVYNLPSGRFEYLNNEVSVSGTERFKTANTNPRHWARS
jgi:hypothetical protein